MIKVLDIYDKLGWKKANGYPQGTRIKTLRNEGNAKTVLLKLPKGFRLESHSHLTTEQHLIIRGKYESEGKVYSSGTYRLIPAGVDHGPFESKTGAVILVIWDPLINKGSIKS
jgi:anti-sigma factor ChrR (cupin superfamily)